MRSQTTAGLNVIYVEFDWNTEIRAARQTIQERLTTLAGVLPEGIQPQMTPPASIMGQIVIAGMYRQPGPKGGELAVLDSTVVRVDTDEGVSGWGEVCPLGPAYLPSYAPGVRTGIAELGPHLLGEDPTRLGPLNRLMDAKLRGHPYVKSPIDVACWDILGKVAGLPCAKLWGGPVRDYVRLAAVVTLVVSVLPFVYLAYRRLAVHVTLDTLASFVALLTAFLIVGRLRHRGTLSDVVLLCALTLFALVNFFFSALPTMVFDARSEGFLAWAAIIGHLIATAAFMTAPFLPDTHLRRPGRAAISLLLASFTLVVIIGLTADFFASRVPTAPPPDVSLAESEGPGIVGHPIVAGLQLAAMVFFAAASIGFTRRAERSGDGMMQWFGAGAALAAFARLNVFLFPSLYSEYLYTGDLMRPGFYLMLLWGAVREISSYWQGLARLAVLEERGRLARNLHDGLAQELTFIWTQTRRFPDRNARQRFELVATAAQRAMDESRRAIAVLTMPIDQPLDLAISEIAGEIAHRWGNSLETDLEEGVHVSPEIQEGLLRIVREAVTNASHHADAEYITVRLFRKDGLHLRVEDDGIGFDVSRARGDAKGFGLSSMEQRARELGGTLRISSRPAAGTRIEVRLP